MVIQEWTKVPEWVEHLLSTSFFSACQIHTKHRNECNKYCIDCTHEAFCSYCLPSLHNGHHVIQIRRSSYEECVRVEDIQKTLDIKGVQTFVINSAKVIFLNKRGRCVSQTKNNGGGGNIRNNLCKNSTQCITCQRTLLEPFWFCSIQCKFEWVKKDESGKILLSVKNEEENETRLKNKEKEQVSQSEIDHPHARTLSYNSRKRKGIPRRAPFF